jgi:uncharacterized protein YhdP
VLSRTRRAGTLLWYACAALIVAAAVLVSLTRLLLPLAGNLRGEIEARVSAHLGQPVRIEAFAADLRGFRPVLRLKGVELLHDGATLAGIDELRVTIAPLGSLRLGRIEPVGLQAVGARLALQRLPDGSFALRGLQGGDASGPSGGQGLQWLLRQERIAFSSGELFYQDLASGGAPLRFSELKLSLKGDGRLRHLSGSARLPEQLGRSIEFSADIEAAEAGGWSGLVRLTGASIALGAWPVPGQRVPIAGSADIQL